LHDVGFYWFVLGAVALCVAAAWLLMASPAGRVARAIGRNPVRLSAMGYRVWLYRTGLTLFASVVGAIGGWLYALQTSFVTTELLGQTTSIQGLSGALIGGVETILGPVLGSALLSVLDNQLSRGSTQSSLFLGAALILSLVLMPDGILGRFDSWMRTWKG
jgi:branched-chain amino acid transport system permease protein